MNLGICNKIKAFFPKTVVVARPKVINKQIPNPYWLSGFVQGEGCFFISIYKSQKSKLGLSVQLVFKITQHSRDIVLLKTIAIYFNCGRVVKRNTNACDFTVNCFKDFQDKVVPFFLVSTSSFQVFKF